VSRIKPPSYGIPSDEKCERIAKIVVIAILVTVVLNLVVFIGTYSYSLNYAVAIVLMYLTLLIFGLSFALWMVYNVIKSTPQNILKAVNPYVKAVNPDFWAMGGFFRKWIVMKKGDTILALLMGFDCKLVVCRDWTETMEKPIKLKNLKPVDEILIDKRKFKIYSCDYAVLPSPIEKGKALACRNPIVIVLSKWFDYDVGYNDFLRISQQFL